MNIAFSTILIFLFITPGLIFSRFYYTAEFSKQYFKQSFFDVFISTFLPAIIFHCIWYYLIRIFGYKINLKVIGQLLFENNYPEEAIKNIQTYFPQILLYHYFIFMFAGYTGYISKFIVRNLGLDRQFKLFRFQNNWHYIFKGEFFEFPRAGINLVNDKVSNIEFVYIDVMVESNEGTLIYDGILVDYELSKDGGLYCFYLKDARRRYLKDDPTRNNHNEQTKRKKILSKQTNESESNNEYDVKLIS